MNVINAITDISSIFPDNHFSMEKWELYIDKQLPGAKEKCTADMKGCINSGASFENDFLPVLDYVCENPKICDVAVNSFLAVTDSLDEKIINVFNKTVDADVILYIGLCNGAGWATEINGRTTVLLGVEKILELGWYSVDDMTGLIVHELGHIYHNQYGFSVPKTDTSKERYIWQLFREGVAMVFEQEIIGKDNYFHQDKNGWKNWCDKNVMQIKQSFNKDIENMTPNNQCYFGDWVKFHGYGDTGYYLGALFVRYLLRFDSFDNIIRYSLDEVKEKYRMFAVAAE